MFQVKSPMYEWKYNQNLLSNVRTEIFPKSNVQSMNLNIPKSNVIHVCMTYNVNVLMKKSLNINLDQAHLLLSGTSWTHIPEIIRVKYKIHI